MSTRKDELQPGGNVQYDAKRQRLDNTTEQRASFEEDMMRIRFAMNVGSSNNNNASSSATPFGDGAGDGSVVPRAIPRNGGDTGGGAICGGNSTHQEQSPPLWGGSTQQRQASGEPTLQYREPPSRRFDSQRQTRPTHAAGSATGMNGGRSMGGSLDSEDENDCENTNWLKSFTPRSVTRVGENYQVTNLPAAPSRAAPAVPISPISPGGTSSEGLD